MVDNLPKSVAVDLTGQMAQLKRTWMKTVMAGPPDETDPSGELEKILQNTTVIEMHQNQSLIRILSCPSLIKSYGYLLYLLLISSCTNFKPDQKQPPVRDSAQETPLKIDVDTSVVDKSQEQTQFDEDSYQEPVSSKPDVVDGS